MDIGQLLRKDQRGVALPMAMMALLVLGALVVAFSVLSASEPTIANNQLRAAQARALAEAGLEQAIWALGHPSVTGGLPYPLPDPPPAPYYNEQQLVPVSVGGTQLGGFTVSVSQGTERNDRVVVATGWVPTKPQPWDPNAWSQGAHRKVTATVTTFRPLPFPCALCVNGDLDVSGTSVVDSRADTTCGSQAGTFSTGDTTLAGNASVYGAGDSTKNQIGQDILTNQDEDDFEAFAFTNNELNILKDMAKAAGTYYQGSVTFDAGNKLPDGIVFVDTTTGNNITDSTPSSDFASVTVNGNAGKNANNTFRGWIVSNGGITMSGNLQIEGLVYAVNDIVYSGTGTGRVTGAVVSANIRDTAVSSIDSTAIGNSLINYNCAAIMTMGGMRDPNAFFVKRGSYRELSD